MELSGSFHAFCIPSSHALGQRLIEDRSGLRIILKEDTVEIAVCTAGALHVQFAKSTGRRSIERTREYELDLSLIRISNVTSFLSVPIASFYEIGI